METLQLNVLDGFEGFWRGQAMAHFPTEKVRALFVYLCLEPERLHRREALAGLLWSHCDTKVSRRNLRQSLLRLKRTLDALEPGLSDTLVTATRNDIQLDGTKIRLDVQQVTAWIERHDAKGASVALDDAEALGQLEGLIERYKGEPLAGIELSDESLFNDWLHQVQDGIRQQMIGLLSRLAAGYQSRREWAAADRVLTAWLALEPWTEEAHRARMHVLAMSGQRSAALAQYHTCVEILLAEFQADPTDETVELYEQIHLEEVGGERATPKGGLHHFPPETTPFVGREHDLRQLADSVVASDKRLLSLLGTGGTGKTRLAMELARKIASQEHPFVDGIYWVPLASLAEGEQLFSALAQSLGLAVQASDDLATRVQEFLAARRLLLVWDNFEHVLSANVVLSQMLAEAPHIKMIVTSRLPLNIVAEHRYTLGGLGLYSACELFLQRAEQVNGKVDPIHDQDAIQAICDNVGGSPLAIELAASWTRSLTCQDIVEELQQDLDLLQGEWSDLPERHRSIRAIFSYTFSTLGEKEQQVLLQAALFRGGFSLSAARQVLKASVRTLTQLVECALLHRTVYNRYDCHALVRQFIEERAAETTEASELMQRYRQHYLGVVQGQEVQLLGGTRSDALVSLQQDIDNIRQAWQLSIDAGDLVLLEASAGGFVSFMRYLGFFAEAVELLQRAERAAQASAEPGAARSAMLFRLHQADLLAEVGKPVLSMIEGIEEADLSGDRRATALWWFVQGYSHLNASEFSTALGHFRRALELFEGLGDVVYTSLCYDKLGYVQYLLCDYDNALVTAEQGLAFDQAHEYLLGEGRKLCLFGYCRCAFGQISRAQEHFKKALHDAHQMEARVEIARYSNNLAVVLRRMGRHGESLEHNTVAATMFAALGIKLHEMTTLSNIGVIHWDQGRYQLATHYIQRSIEGFRALGLDGRAAMVCLHLGQVCIDMGRFAEAEEHILRSVEQNRQSQQWAEEGRGLAIYGELKRTLGESQGALQYLKEASHILRECNSKAELCICLFHYAEELLEEGQLDAAQEANLEGIRCADELENPLWFAYSKGLQARILARLGRAEEAEALLASVQGEYEYPLEAQAALAESAWLVSQEPEHKEQAVERLQDLCQQIPSVRNKRRLARLLDGGEMSTEITERTESS